MDRLKARGTREQVCEWAKLRFPDEDIYIEGPAVDIVVNLTDGKEIAGLRDLHDHMRDRLRSCEPYTQTAQPKHRIWIDHVQYAF
jgi:hypothetical protein